MGRTTLWTEQEREFLRTNYAILSLREIAEELKRPLKGVHYMSRKINSNTLKKPWSETEDDFIRKNYGFVLAKDIAKQLNRTVMAVQARSFFLGVGSAERRSSAASIRANSLSAELKLLRNNALLKFAKKPKTQSQRSKMSLTRCKMLMNRRGYNYRFEYSGVPMRSSWEVEFARWCDFQNLDWEYEPELFESSNGLRYIPDFKIKGFYVEVKGYLKESDICKMNSFVNSGNTLYIVDKSNIFSDDKLNKRWEVNNNG